MEFLEIAKSRYSVRDYKSRKVEPEKLEKILLAAHVTYGCKFTACPSYRCAGGRGIEQSRKSGKPLWSSFGNYRLRRTYESMDTPV